MHNLFRCNFFSTLRRPFPPTPAQRGRHPPPIHVACYKPRPLLFESLFSNPFCFRQRCETIEIDRSSISFILQFLSWNSLQGRPE